MPYTIPDLRISPEQCFLHTPPELYTTLKDVIDIFENTSHDAYPDLTETYGIDTFIKNGEFNIYLTGGRAFYLVVTSLHSKLKSVFWETFDWDSFEKLYMENRDYDIQCCWRNSVICRIDDIMKRSFEDMKYRINATDTDIQKDTMSCSNGTIDIAWIQQKVDHIDIMNNAFRINLITHEVECMSKAGLDLLLYEHQMDVPNIIDYIKHSNKNRAMSKMAFATRNIAKAFTLGFTLSKRTLAGINLGVEKVAYSNQFQSYMDEKIAKLINEHGEDKAKHLHDLAGLEEQTWLEKLKKQHHFNVNHNTATIDNIPHAEPQAMLKNIKRLAAINKVPKHKSEAIEKYLVNTFAFHVPTGKIKILVEELEKLSQHHDYYTKAISLCKLHIESGKPKISATPIQVSPPRSPMSSSPSINTSPISSATTSPILSIRNTSVKPRKSGFSARKLDHIDKIRKSITPQAFKSFKECLDNDYAMLYYDASVNYKKFVEGTLADANDRYHHHPNPERIKAIRSILNKNENILFASDLQKIAVGVMYVIIGLSLMIIFRGVFVENQKPEPMNPSTRLVFLASIICSFLIGLYRSNSISPESLNNCGVTDSMICFNLSIAGPFKKQDADLQICLLTQIGCIISYGNYFFISRSMDTFHELAKVCLKNPALSLGLAKLVYFVHKNCWSESSRNNLICNILHAMAALEIDDVILLLREGNFNLTGLGPEEILQGFEDALEKIALTNRQPIVTDNMRPSVLG